MIPLKDITESYESIIMSMKKRGRETKDIDALVLFYKEKKEIIASLDELRGQRNKISQEHKGKIEDSSILDSIFSLKKSILLKEEELLIKDAQLQELLYTLPNILDESVPVGATEEDNKEVAQWGAPKKMAFTPRSHDQIGKECDILDIERGVKISGSRFYTLKKEGALLERAIIQFFLDSAIKAGYTEVIAPVLVKSKSMFGTGQLPKFKEDMFKIEGEDLYLIPTAEVSITNLYQDEILKSEDLPMSFCSFSSCFRKEAGSYGKDTKGIFRVHQFQKVELVKYAHPESSQQEFEHLTAHAESLLKALELPYKKMLLCSQDTGFSSMKTYDLEVYLPFEGRYREISSCSLFGDFQARRANIKFKNKDRKNEYIHTINGSGLAVGRTWVAIVENYQNEDGSISVPNILQKYMNGVTHIQRRTT